ncbi:beta-hydroxyacyl-ACP dehydratase [Xylella fastidiosa subsp. morus]|uniref:Dehydratase n=4 Tax=Xylella fastidiosa TaxID=2371 RepID=Q87AE1_XYLFT|nr:3-hydroxyacyl-ACP dehydratase FabZ family protein [Xylella fastidiosa]ADN62750.1 putative dehydratase [Xylella fastidiosa subsp. fastidiosa GB514]ERI60098.1 dehydratase [Xylella fastidiosa subsp. multiplex Griffin-1]AAO29716.1 dehydratase [Xylella fastidiosa Temecula1]ACA12934.1 dehydratase [Xylella fastidiosa M12]ACB93390.1 putative dehydratase [Xylella fastidiosa M23]
MEFSIPKTHPCFPGHFPGFAVVPGVLVLAQVLHALQVREGRLTGICLPQVKFLRSLLPEQQARIELEGAMPRWRFRVCCADTLLASGEIVAGSGA